MDEVELVLESIVTTALDDAGWSFLQPRMSDGSLGTQIDSTDVAELVTRYLLIAFKKKEEVIMGGISTDYCSFHGMTADKCFNLHNPNAHKKVGWPKWSAQENDTIGGWMVTTYPFPASEHDFSGKGESPTWENRHTAKDRCGYMIADCMTEEDAITISTLLNEECYIPKDATDNPDRWRWVEADYLWGSERSL